MTIKRIIKASWRLLPLLVLTGFLTGCLKENTDGCGTECLLHIRAFDAEGRELTQNEVTSVYLYVFDGNMMFAGSYRTQLGEAVRLEVGRDENLHIVAWGNLNGNSDPHIGDNMGQSYISLRSATRAGNKVVPDDIFYGSLTISGNDVSHDKDVPIYRKVGSMTVVANNIKDFAGFDDNDYSIVIGETYSSIGFDGTFSGDRVDYNPDGEFVLRGGREIYFVAPFNVIPEQTGLHIDFYHGTDLIASVSTDRDGNPITVTEGMQTNVTVDFSSSVEVDITLTQWGDMSVGKEF